MGNICGFCSVEEQLDNSYENRLANLEKRLLDIEQHMFLDKNIGGKVDGRNQSNRKKYNDNDNTDPSFFYQSNPIRYSTKTRDSDLSAPLYPNTESAYAMAWSN